MNRWLRLALQLLSVLAFGLILWWAGPEVWEQVLGGDVLMFCLAFVLHGLAGMVSGQRLRVITDAVSGRKVASWRRFYYLNMMARTLGLVLPRGISTVGGKSAGISALGISLKRSVWAVLMDNLFDLLWLGMLSVPAILFFQTGKNPVWFWSSAGLLTALLLWGLRWTAKTGRLVILFEHAKQIPWLARKLKLEQASAAHLLPDSGPLMHALSLTILLNALLPGALYFVGQAVGVSAPFMLVLASFPIAQLSLIIAIAPGGLGIFDLGWLGLLRLGAISEDEAFAFVVAQRAYVLIFVLFWLLVSLLLSLTERQQLPAGISPEEEKPGGL